MAELRVFATIAETGHFTRAADQLGMSQSALSAAIVKLEKLLGTRLFDRHTRACRPTDAGVALGRAFLDAGFADEAVDTLGSVITDYVNKGDKRSIEMTYLYGRALEQKGDKEAAIKAYSQVTQWDFNYKDTQARLKKAREKPPEQT